MKNPINYTKEDIYMIAEMAGYLEMYGGNLENKHAKFVNELVDCLTLEEQEDEYIKRYKYIIANYYEINLRGE